MEATRARSMHEFGVANDGDGDGESALGEPIGQIGRAYGRRLCCAH